MSLKRTSFLKFSAAITTIFPRPPKLWAFTATPSANACLNTPMVLTGMGTGTRIDTNARSRNEEDRRSRIEDRRSRIALRTILRFQIFDPRSSILYLRSSILDPRSSILYSRPSILNFLVWLLTGPQPIHILSAPKRRVLIPTRLIYGWL